MIHLIVMNILFAYPSEENRIENGTPLVSKHEINREKVTLGARTQLIPKRIRYAYIRL